MYLSCSVIIRTYNEDQYLEELILAIKSQAYLQHLVEIIVVDSGSTDNTINIVKKHNCILKHIPKSEFSFGRSLNIGCLSAIGEILVFISGHCIPYDKNWLKFLLHPFIEDNVGLVYGRQIGGDKTKFSEHQIFKKYFPDYDRECDISFFCNNANSALRKTLWNVYNFNESLSGLEDMDIAKKLFNDSYRVRYACNASVYHYHNETWVALRNRYFRESLALREIMPEIHFRFLDFLFCFTFALFSDTYVSILRHKYPKYFFNIIFFRFNQFYGSYLGSKMHNKSSKRIKSSYYYPSKEL